MDFPQTLLTSVLSSHSSSFRKTPLCQFPILMSKVNYEDSEIAQYLLANKLVCHSFMDTLEGMSLQT